MELIKEISEILKDAHSRPASETNKLIDKKLAEPGTKGVREEWTEARVNSSCDNYGNIEERTCYKVNHGDGTSSPPWCDDWHCK
ncbi:hypothetical protein EOD41_13015 [Mucilaginibacter limnophilus]|uniref:Uncharacterized protein n=1 Tax=Mucilaginibacter limnophilus TaxID=1932778 RepID=A0A3S2UL53_9SPHI|nr:hypothetical protein [Mucilaginibacter limnophilus]RVU00394.1 hypothetical protein EOD41_13015 [Mucilaginibacter limnophilus]